MAKSRTLGGIILSASAAFFTSASFVPHASAEDLKLDELKFEIYGFAQADYIQDYNRVNPDWEDTLRPSKIATHDDQFGQDGQASLSAKQTRLGVKSNVPVDGDSVYTQVEFDFFGVGSDEGQFTIRPRHFYGEYRQILGGQTNSLFMDVDIFPNVIDYWGPAGMVFLRTPQLRWTPIKGANRFAIAIEKPTNDIDPGDIREIDPSLGENISPDDNLPDLTAQYRFTGEDWGHVQLAGIVRRIGFETNGTTNNEPKGDGVGWGADLTSVIKPCGSDALRLGAVIGQGIASYMNDGGTDLAPKGTPGNLDSKAVPLWGISAYYDHNWTEKWTTSFGYARTQVDNTSFQAADAFHKGEYASVNLLHSPVKDVLFGIEGLWGAREDHDGSNGHDLRTQVSAKYTFSSLGVLPAKAPHDQ